MTSLRTVKRAGSGVAEAARLGDWAKADRELQYLIGAWQRAGLRGKAAVEATAMLDGLRMDVTTEHDVDQRVGPVQIAWMLAGVCSFVKQAAVPAALTGHDVESRILEALAADGDPMPTAHVAERIGHSVSATARALTKLRAERLTAGASAGRNVLNGITPAGRTKAEELKAEARRRERLAKEGPGSLARPSGVRPESVEIGELRRLVQPNEIASLRLAEG